jgi:glycosyltransferase involved in cell wall biosynthesis
MARLDGACHLTVVGSETPDPAYARRVRRRIARDGLAPHVTLLGERPPAEVAAHLARSHVLALPSAPESYAIAYLEAMSHGLPVLANAASDAASMVTHGTTGFVVPPGDAPALAAHLRLLHEDRNVLGAMGVAARRFYEAHPTWEESMERAHEFLVALHAACRERLNKRGQVSATTDS